MFYFHTPSYVTFRTHVNTSYILCSGRATYLFVHRSLSLSLFFFQLRVIFLSSFIAMLRVMEVSPPAWRRGEKSFVLAYQKAEKKTRYDDLSSFSLKYATARERKKFGAVCYRWIKQIHLHATWKGFKIICLFRHFWFVINLKLQIYIFVLHNFLTFVFRV